MQQSFRNIDIKHIVEKLNQISIAENLSYSNESIYCIANLAKGDLRKAINLLQKCFNSYGDKVNEELLDEMSGVIPSDKFNKLIASQ